MADTYPEHPVIMVDDEESWRISFETALNAAGIDNIIGCGDGRKVMSLLVEHDASVLLLDLILPEIGGQEILPNVVREFPEVPVIIISGMNELDTAVNCMRNGAYDYLVKTAGQTELVSAVKRAIELRGLRAEYETLKTKFLYERLENPRAFRDIVTQNKRMGKIFQYAEAIAASDSPVLISGETGVGKELVAKAVHNLSGRGGPFVAVNVAGLDDTVFSDTLFGHVKGAFTNAAQKRAGLVSKAMGGTLLLDEIGDLNPESQVKLLRLLQENEYFPLGADNPVRSGARVITATQLDLETSIKSGQFRKDLFYRLNTHHIKMPPLRERRDDLPLLVDYFMRKASSNLKKRRPPVPEKLVGLLKGYSFPGNIRELQSMVFDAMAGHKSGLLPMEPFRACIEENPVATASAQDAKEGGTIFANWDRLPHLKDAAKELVAEAILRTGGNRSAAAELLGITRQALSWRLKQEE